MSNVGFPDDAYNWEAFDTDQPSTGTSAGSVGGDGPARASGRRSALSTVGDFVTTARSLLQDTATPYRYATSELVFGLNAAMLEARRLRPDLFAFSPAAAHAFFTDADLAVAVPIEPAYRMAYLFYLCGFVQIRDDEATQDSRAAAFITRFTAQLLSMTS